MSDFLPLFRRHLKNLKQVGTGPEHVDKCPYSECGDKTKRTFYVNGDTGQYICHRCGVSGNPITFALTFGEDPRPFYDTQISSTEVDLDLIEGWQRNLLEHPGLWRRPWIEDEIRRLRVGWDPRVKTLVFPIFDESGTIINVVHHKKFQIRGSHVTFYPHNLLGTFDPIYLMIVEGLPDAVTGLSRGFQVIASTGGASVVPSDITVLMRFSKAYLIPHNDRSGEDGVQKWIQGIRGQVPNLKLRICDLSPFVGEKGDLTDYFNIKGKTRATFISEVLKPARLATLYSDLPNFIRDRMLSPEFCSLKPEDQATYTQLAMRAARYRVPSIYFRGMVIKIPPGGFWTTYGKMLDYCPFLRSKTASIKRIRNSIDRLIKAGFISKQDLSWRRGLLIRLTGWPEQREGHSSGHNNAFTKDLLDYPPPPFWNKGPEREESDD